MTEKIIVTKTEHENEKNILLAYAHTCMQTIDEKEHLGEEQTQKALSQTHQKFFPSRQGK
jgi:hypothetical protein